MGVRGEVWSTTVQLENRTYFFNVKENRVGDLYLNMVESKNKDGGGFDRQSIVLFADDLQEFLKGFDESLKVMEKSQRAKNKAPKAAKTPEDSGKRSYKKSDGTAGKKKSAKGPRSDRNEFAPKNEGAAKPTGKRLMVKKTPENKGSR